MNQAIEGVRWTIHDLEVLPENEWTRYEIINGELFVTRTPHRRHQQVCVKIVRQLDVWSDSSGLGETIVAPGVIFSQADSVIPDVVWVSREQLGASTFGRNTGRLEIAATQTKSACADSLKPA
ncbi:Uma2 family endonuclease [Nostoc sp.]|uniref:Uma2 family endonuclease n=1 Tax=Nostoc sp. TaxID=1180 RepID=UPI003FA52A6A